MKKFDTRKIGDLLFLTKNSKILIKNKTFNFQNVCYRNMISQKKNFLASKNQLILKKKYYIIKFNKSILMR